ncbi:hypothetical protein TSOC_008618 [Tetrabaena socialis]|uniref:DOMON domain-containing protein n=1 Tax=Tetrabaena socialis TaxID=47790 RepID=A0A2J7ZY40_9CHLO|nr:hypothetical protein TSOC_008618 [Tetrabaena socialis]|eukprot:PNH05189.1 hypothetical protein TSOC_008618 [Tetrabaena socialis]
MPSVDMVGGPDAWLAVALSEGGGMIGADMRIVAGGGEDGGWRVIDAHSLEFAQPLRDTQQDVSLLGQPLSGPNNTVAVVTRRLRTCDPWDKEVLVDVPQTVSWAYGRGYPSKHTARGNSAVFFVPEADRLWGVNASAAAPAKAASGSAGARVTSPAAAAARLFAANDGAQPATPGGRRAGPAGGASSNAGASAAGEPSVAAASRDDDDSGGGGGGYNDAVSASLEPVLTIDVVMPNITVPSNATTNYLCTHVTLPHDRKYHIVGWALEHSGSCVDLAHQLAAAALALLVACAEQQNGQDAATFAATCGIMCNWGACAHPLLASVAADVLSTLVQHAEPALASRLIAAVARLTGLAAATEAAAAAAAVVGGGGEGAAGRCSGWSGGAGGTQRLQRLLACMLTAAAPQAAPAWREALERHSRPDPQLPHVPTDLCGAAAARVLWGAAAAAAAASAQAAAARGGAPGEGEPAAGVSEQELGARAQQLLAAVRQAYAVMSSCSGGASGPVVSGSVAAAAALARHWLAQLLGCLEVTVAHMRHLQAPALKALVAEAGTLASEVLPALCPSTFTGAASLAMPASAGGASAAAGQAAARLLARAGDLLPPGAASALAPALLRLAEQGAPAVAADVAAAAAHCNCPPQEELFHALLRSQHPTVQHAAMQSLLAVSRTAPQQYAAGIRRLFPPEAPQPPRPHPQQAGAGPNPQQGQQPPQAAPPPYLAGVFKSYVARRLGVAEEEAAAATARQGRAGEGARLEPICFCRPIQSGATSEARWAVQQGVEAMRVCLEELALSRSASSAPSADADPMDTAAGQGPYPAARDTPFARPPAQFPAPAGPPDSAPGPAGSAPAPGTGPLSSLVADDNAALGGLSAALGGLERSLGALNAAVRGQGINARRPSEWDQLQVHARAMLGDLSSATARIRSMSELLYTLQGR